MSSSSLSEMPLDASTGLRVILVAIGGSSCSGKTTLATHIQSILPGSIMIHQDDFAPAAELIPIHPVHEVQDWDSAPGAIDWPRFVSCLQHVKRTGSPPAHHTSHEHMNRRDGVSVPDEAVAHWRRRFSEECAGGRKVLWVLVDGFLLYWHKDVLDQLDVRVLLRTPRGVLAQRRAERNGYYTAEGSMWQDPPGYWDNVAYPAYVDAHRRLFEGGDVERGKLSREGEEAKLLLMDALEVGMGELVETCCRALMETLEIGK